jgi:fructokinase
MGVVVIGAVLWDIFDDARHIGGAPFNMAAHAQRLGVPTAFISGVGDDDLGREILQQARALGLDTRYIRTATEAATGTVDVFLTDGQPDYTIHRPAAYDYPALSAEDLKSLTQTHVEWIYFGTVEQTSPQVRQVTQTLLNTFPSARRFFDINLRKSDHTLGLIEELLHTTTILKVNEEELVFLGNAFGSSYEASQTSCQMLATRFELEYICLTRGERGCAIWHQDEFIESPGYSVPVDDTIGAGDAFSAAFMHGLEQHWPLAQIADFANRLGALVAAKSGAVPDWTAEELRALR